MMMISQLVLTEHLGPGEHLKEFSCLVNNTDANKSLSNSFTDKTLFLYLQLQLNFIYDKLLY